ncbi:MAG: ribosome-associated translation inhibitor RaiA [Pseudomonadota bacterium]
MQLNLTGHHIEITDALRNRVSAKVAKMERHFDHVTDVNVILTVEKLEHKAEATVNVPGETLYAESVENDMYAAIDLMADKLDRQVRKFKEKLTDHHARDVSKTTRMGH